MEMVLGPGLGPKERSYIEDAATKVKKDLRIMELPNVYDYSSVKSLYESMGLRCEFEVEVNNSRNSMMDSWDGDTIYNNFKYNVLEKADSKIIQLPIKNQISCLNKSDYMQFLGVIFWEYWHEYKKETELNGVEFTVKNDYSFFVREMLIPETEFIKAVTQTSNNPENVNVIAVAKIFNVDFQMVIGRVRDYKWK